MWSNWSLQACYFNPPAPTLPPLFLCHLFSVVACLGLDSRFSSRPTPLGSLYVLSVSLPFQSTLPKAFAARKISLTSEYSSYVLCCTRGTEKVPVLKVLFTIKAFLHCVLSHPDAWVSRCLVHSSLLLWQGPVPACGHKPSMGAPTIFI